MNVHQPITYHPDAPVAIVLSPGVGGKPTKAMLQRESPPKLAPLDGNEASDGVPEMGGQRAGTRTHGAKKPVATPATPSTPVSVDDAAAESTNSAAHDDAVASSTIVRVASTSSFASVNLE